MTSQDHKKSNQQFQVPNTTLGPSVPSPGSRWSKQLLRKASKYLSPAVAATEWIPTEEDLETYVLSGRVKHLPKRNPKVVRIFLSSTFSDMYIERNALYKHVYPRLQMYCNTKHDMEFQVVDMRWGVRSTATNDHSGAKLCMTELKICQEESLGPNFVLLLGQRYGTRHIPPVIAEDEFTSLVNALVALKVPGADIEFLKCWYLCDINAVPPLRRLQSLDVMKVDRKEFSDSVDPRLRQMLRAAADWCLGQRWIDENRHRTYFWSVTEEEVYNGILNAPKPNEHCLCFTREIKDINYKSDKVERFVDMLDAGAVDKEAQDLLADLKRRVYSVLDKENVVELPPVQWCDRGGTNEDVHADYLSTFCDAFYNKVVNMIDKAACKDDVMFKLSKSPVLSETMEHSHQAKAKFQTFQGRADILDQIKSYIQADNSVLPFIVHGGSGFGKTSILAMASINVFEWLSDSEQLLVVRRFLGTTPDSTNIESLLYSIAAQVKQCLSIRLPFVEDPVMVLNVLLSFIPKHVRLVLFLDSLDQLSAAGKAHTLAWLPLEVPSNVKIVVSTLPQEHGLLDILKSREYPDANFAQVEVLDVEASLQLLKEWLASKHRRLSSDQLDIIAAKFRIVSQTSPLYIKLMFDILKDIPSYFSSEKFLQIFESLDNPANCIQYVIEELRQKHGITLVNTAFAFLHLSNQGLTESEIVHLISLDDVVLSDVFQFHMPPLRRLPALLWTRIRHDVSEYIVEREANGAKVLAWYHRQFIESGERNFVMDVPQERKRELHLLMVDFFMGVWANGKPKPFTYSDEMVKKLQLSSNQAEADRFVPVQPNLLSNNKPNLRKLSQLPPLLIATDKIDLFLIEIVGSIESLVSMFETYTWTEIYEVLQKVKADRFKDKVIKKAFVSVLRCLLLCCATASMYPAALGPLLAGRLLPLYGASTLVDHLLEDIYSKGLEHNALVVRHNQLEGFGSYLLFEMTNDHVGPCYCIQEIVYHGHNYIMSVSRRAAMIDMETGNVSVRYTPPRLQDGDHFSLLTAAQSNSPEYIAAALTQVPKVFVFSVKRQECTGSFDCRKVKGFEEFLISDMLAFRESEKELVVVWGVGLHGFLLYSLQECDLLHHYSTDSRIFLVLHNSGNLTVVQSGQLLGVTITYNRKFKLDTSKDKQCIALPSSLLITAKHFSDDLLALATSDHKLLMWGSSEAAKSGCRLILDSPAHCLTRRKAELIACTRDCVYLITTTSSRASFAVRSRIIKRLDWAVMIKNQQLVGYRLGSISVLEFSDSAGMTEVSELMSFVGHSKPITDVIVNSDIPTMFMSCSADGTIRVFDRARPINKYIAEMSKFDRADVRINTVCGNGLYGLSVAKENRMVAVWSLENGRILHKLYHRGGAGGLLDALVLGQFVVTADISTLFIWKLEDSADVSSPFRTINLHGYCNMFAKSDSEVIVISKESVMELGLPTCNVVLTRSLPKGKRIISLSWTPLGLALLVDPDQPTVHFVVDESSRSKVLAGQPCLETFGPQITSIHRCQSMFVLAFHHHVVFFNFEKNSILTSFEMKRPILIKSSSTIIGVQSGLAIHFFEVNNGVTKLGSLKLSSVKDTAALSSDGRHCIVTKMPKMVHLYRLSDMAVVGAYSCYGDVECVALTRDCRHVLVAMADTRLLSFLIIDNKYPEHTERIQGILKKPLTGEEVATKRRMLNAAGTMDSGYGIQDSSSDSDDEDKNSSHGEYGDQTESIPDAKKTVLRVNISDIRLVPDENVTKRDEAYVQCIISSTWKFIRPKADIKEPC